MAVQRFKKPDGTWGVLAGGGTTGGGEALPLYFMATPDDFNETTVESLGDDPCLASIKSFLLNCLATNASTMQIVQSRYATDGKLPSVKVVDCTDIVFLTLMYALFGENLSIQAYDTVCGITFEANTLEIDGEQSTSFIIYGHTVVGGNIIEEGSISVSSETIRYVMATVNADGSISGIQHSALNPVIYLSDDDSLVENKRVIKDAVFFGLIRNIVFSVPGYDYSECCVVNYKYDIEISAFDFTIVKDSAFSVVRVGLDGTVTENPE